MADHPERKRVLRLLAAKHINAAEAKELLTAIEAPEYDRARANSATGRSSTESGRSSSDGNSRRVARSLRIAIDSTTPAEGAAPGGEEEEDRNSVVVTVPLSLAKFAGKLIPEAVRIRLEEEGVELVQLLQELDSELPEGRLVDIDNALGGNKRRRARIVVEVV